MERLGYIRKIGEYFNVTPATALLGPRQCGKTTLARMYGDIAGTEIHRFDLENPTDIARLEDPQLALRDLKGLIVIDEIQLRPDLFPILRVLIDEHLPQKYLILGSASRDLIKQSSETLAGRISYIELTPFTLAEVGNDHQKTHWLRGGFPMSFLAQNDRDSYLWRENYVRTFLERDIPALGIQILPQHLRRFWMMVSHFHGQIVNFSDIGNSLDIADVTARKYLDILSGTFMIRQLSPWFENISKRQVKRPKLYFRDSGILHFLLGVDSMEALRTHPKLGASWEGYALEETIRYLNAAPEECFFWGVHAQAELDLLIIKDGQKRGFEFKYSDAPKMTDSIRKSVELLKLDSIDVIYPGNIQYQLAENVFVKPLPQRPSQ